MKRFLMSAVAVALVLGSLASSAQAQAIKGIQLLKQLDGGDQMMFQDPNFWVSATVKETWVRNLPKLNQTLQTKIAEMNAKLPHGVTIYQQQSILAKNVEVSTSLIKNSVVVKMMAKRNVMFFKTTTPTVFGSYGDPKFSLTYDLEFAVAIPIPTKVQPLQAKSATVKMTNVKWDSQNFAGDLVKSVDAIYAFVTHKSFMAKLNDPRDFDVAKMVNANLSRANTPLSQLRSAGFSTLEHSIDPKTKTLKLVSKK